MKGYITVANGRTRSAHRANYTLELGVWHATCRECGYKVSDPARRRAAAVYRGHIVAMQGVPSTVLDLTAGASVEPIVLDLTRGSAGTVLLPGRGAS